MALHMDHNPDPLHRRIVDLTLESNADLDHFQHAVQRGTCFHRWVHGQSPGEGWPNLQIQSQTKHFAHACLWKCSTNDAQFCRSRHTIHQLIHIHCNHRPCWILLACHRTWVRSTKLTNFGWKTSLGYSWTNLRQSRLPVDWQMQMSHLSHTMSVQQSSSSYRHSFKLFSSLHFPSPICSTDPPRDWHCFSKERLQESRILLISKNTNVPQIHSPVSWQTHSLQNWQLTTLTSRQQSPPSNSHSGILLWSSHIESPIKSGSPLTSLHLSSAIKWFTS